MIQRNDKCDLAPTGNSVLAIVSADVRDLPWRASHDNAAGSCLCLVLSAGDGYASIRSDLPLDHRRLLEQLAESVGCDLAEMTPDYLVGKRVNAVVNHFVGRSGIRKAGVGKWLACPTGANERRLSRNALRHPTTDDLPF